MHSLISILNPVFCRVSPRYLTIAENGKEKKWAHHEGGKKNGAEGSRVPMKAWWFSETKRTSTKK
jgi:hypothetical protein